MMPERFNEKRERECNNLVSNRTRDSSSGTGLIIIEVARFNGIAAQTNLEFEQGNLVQMIAEPALVLPAHVVDDSSQSETAMQRAALATMNSSNCDDDALPTRKETNFH